MDPTLLEGPSAHPVIREWAKPGEYEAMRAKNAFAAEKKRIRSLPEAERAAALRAAKEALKASLEEAKAIKQKAKAEARAKKKEA